MQSQGTIVNICTKFKTILIVASFGHTKEKNYLKKGNWVIRDDAQNTTNHAMALLTDYVIPILIGSPTLALIISIMYHMGEGTWHCLSIRSCS